MTREKYRHCCMCYEFRASPTEPVRTGPCLYSVFVHRLADWLHTAFSGNLAGVTLCFANPQATSLDRGLTPPSNAPCLAHVGFTSLAMTLCNHASPPFYLPFTYLPPLQYLLEW